MNSEVDKTLRSSTGVNRPASYVWNGFCVAQVARVARLNKPRQTLANMVKVLVRKLASRPWPSETQHSDKHLSLVIGAHCWWPPTATILRSP